MGDPKNPGHGFVIFRNYPTTAPPISPPTPIAANVIEFVDTLQFLPAECREWYHNLNLPSTLAKYQVNPHHGNFWELPPHPTILPSIPAGTPPIKPIREVMVWDRKRRQVPSRAATTRKLSKGHMV